MKSVAITSLLLSGAYAFPFVMNAEGVDSSLIQAERQRVRRQQPGTGAGSAANCPFNANHEPAKPVTSQYRTYQPFMRLYVSIANKCHSIQQC